MLQNFETGPSKSEETWAGVKASGEHSLGDNIFEKVHRKREFLLKY
jgi:hypothetical protein